MGKKTEKKVLERLEAISQHLNLLVLEAQKVNTSLRIIADHLEPTPETPPQALAQELAPPPPHAPTPPPPQEPEP
jgi:hypothetical protein